MLRTMIGPALMAMAVCTTAQAIEPENVLVLYNSVRPESQAVRDAYVAAYPGVREFDLNATNVGTASISRANYTTRIRNPLRDFLNGVTTGDDISDEIICIVTTRGLPGRINGSDEFDIFSTWSSLESDLVLLQQDFDSTAGTTASLPTRASGPIDNPWHLNVTSGQPATSFDRSMIKDPLNWVAVNVAGGGQAFRLALLDPSRMYLVCRLDSAPTDEGLPTEVTAVENIEALIARSQNLFVGKCDVQVLFDEYSSGANQLDDDGLSPFYPARQDFDLSTTHLVGEGWDVTHDETNNWVSQAELADPAKPLIIFGTYGENHDIFAGEDPPGTGTYPLNYLYHPGCAFISYESFNGESIVTGNLRQGQASALDFIAAGGTFAIPTIKEPFTFAQTDFEHFVRFFLTEGLTYAEAVYMSIPTLSWQSTPVGDPLARITVYDTTSPDVNMDMTVDVRDLYAHFESPSDINCDTQIDGADAVALRDAIRLNESSDIDAR